MPTPDNQPAPNLVVPVMRGFRCEVSTPFFGTASAPPQGIGCGWVNSPGHGPQFFINLHAEGGFAMSARLDYARYQRFAENFAAIGKQAMLAGNLDEQTPNDPLAALGVAHEVMSRVREALRERKMHTSANDLDAAISTVAKALMIETKDETNG